jgi:hypothetical protein
MERSMANVSGNAYGLTVLSPIMDRHEGEIAYSDLVRDRLVTWRHASSPMSRVPQTYLARFFVLDDVRTQSQGGPDLFSNLTDLLSMFDSLGTAGLPREDHLKSRYLVFSSNFHGGLDDYLCGMWDAIHEEIFSIWNLCYGFEDVGDAKSFIEYIKKCQVKTTLYFVGSNDKPVEEQLKALYLKQEFSKFAIAHQRLPAGKLQTAFRDFVARTRPNDLAGPTWKPGKANYEEIAP